MSKNSRTWNEALFAGCVTAGAAGALPRPVTVNVRTAENGESSANTTPPTICVPLTRQNQVPSGRPLTASFVAAGMSDSLVKPDATIVVNVDVLLTCQV